MGRLIYQVSTSLDGYVADERGNFDWSMPDEEVHRHVNAGEAAIGTYLLGRRMYETMRVWDDPEAFRDGPAYVRDYVRIWDGIQKVVYSSSLSSLSAPATRLEPVFDPAAVEQLKSATERDLGIGGATLAAAALRAGLIDEIRTYVYPVIIGAGLGWLPHRLRLELELRELRRFAGGVSFVSYTVGRGGAPSVKD